MWLLVLDEFVLPLRVVLVNIIVERKTLLRVQPLIFACLSGTAWDPQPAKSTIGPADSCLVRPVSANGKNHPARFSFLAIIPILAVIFVGLSYLFEETAPWHAYDANSLSLGTFLASPEGLNRPEALNPSTYDPKLGTLNSPTPTAQTPCPKPNTPLD